MAYFILREKQKSGRHWWHRFKVRERLIECTILGIRNLENNSGEVIGYRVLVADIEKVEAAEDRYYSVAPGDMFFDEKSAAWAKKIWDNN